MWLYHTVGPHDGEVVRLYVLFQITFLIAPRLYNDEGIEIPWFWKQP
jgi:hypothetical protein